MVPLGAPKAPSENRPANSSPPKAARQLLLVLLLWEGKPRWRRMETTETKMADGNQDGGRVNKGGRGKGEGVNGRGKGQFSHESFDIWYPCESVLRERHRKRHSCCYSSYVSLYIYFNRHCI